MSGEEDNHSGPDGNDSIISTLSRLRACEACKARKVRCDKLDPCSACKSSNLPCRTTPRPVQQKRQRAVVSARFDDQLSKINEQLSQLQASIDTLSKQKAELSSPPIGNRDFGPLKPKVPNVPSPASTLGKNVSPTEDPPYLGDSSFELHSHQTGQLLDIALHNSPAANQGQDVTSSLQSLQVLHKGGSANNDVAFTSDLPMPPVNVALAALKLVQTLPSGLVLCSPFGNGKSFREACQRYYFPIDGYSASDFITTNGGLIGLLGLATSAQLEAHGIDSATAAELITMCSNNVSATIAKLSIFLGPTIENIECLLFGVQTAMANSDHNQAWYLISFAARLCMDSGLNRLKDSVEGIEELNRRKVCFWFTHCFDKALSLNFGRSPNFSDYDISVGYPVLPQDNGRDAIFLWFDLSKLQGRVYEKLYSAKAQQDGAVVKAVNARQVASEFNAVRERLHATIAKMSEAERMWFLDTEITVLANLTLVYRALPSQKPAHPLRFSDECIATSRETLQLHEMLCAKLLTKSAHQIRMYIDWNLSICPFTPFIVILGTAILDANSEDMHLLEQVVKSLEHASTVAPGAKKLVGICKILLRGAKSCVEQSFSSGPPPTAQTPQRQPTASFMGNGIYQGAMMPGTMETDWSTMMPEDWSSLQLDNPDNMSFLFDNYLASSSGAMPMFETDMTRFDML